MFTSSNTLTRLHNYSANIINKNNVARQYVSDDARPRFLQVPGSSPPTQDTLKEIRTLVTDLEGFTRNLEQKVGGLLKGQETEFVNGYKQHMVEVESTLKKYQEKIEQYERQIDYYQNEGPLASLLKKITFLEEREKKMLGAVEKKNQQILALKIDLKVQVKEK